MSRKKTAWGFPKTALQLKKKKSFLTITGTAAKAVKLETARAINVSGSASATTGGITGSAQSFDGSANITITATVPAATTALAGAMSGADKTKLDGVEVGAQKNTVTSVAGKTGAINLAKADVGLGNADNTADSAKAVLSATKLATARSLKTDLSSTAAVSFDGSAAQEKIPITGVLPTINGGTGNAAGQAATAIKLATSRVLSISGDATGSASFDGSANAAIAVTLASVATAGSVGETANKTLTYGDTFVTPQVTIDAKGRTTAITARAMTMPAAPTSVTGNAGTATKLQTARAINVSGDITGTAQNFDGSASVTIPTTLASVARNNTASTASPVAGGTFTALDSITTDTKGRVTGVNTKTITLPGDASDKPRLWIDSSLGYKPRQLIYQSAALAAQTSAVCSKPAWGNTVNGLHLCGWMTGTSAGHLVIYDMSDPHVPVEIPVPTTTGQIYGCAYSRNGDILAICESTTPWVEFFSTATIPYTKVGDGISNGYATAATGCPVFSKYSSDPWRFYCLSTNKLFKFGIVSGNSPNAYNTEISVSSTTGLTGMICEVDETTVYTANKATTGSANIVKIAYLSEALLNELSDGEDSEGAYTRDGDMFYYFRWIPSDPALGDRYIIIVSARASRVVADTPLNSLVSWCVWLMASSSAVMITSVVAAELNQKNAGARKELG